MNNNVYLNVMSTIIAITLIGIFFINLFTMLMMAWVGDSTESTMYSAQDTYNLLLEVNQNVADVEYWVSP